MRSPLDEAAAVAVATNNILFGIIIEEYSIRSVFYVFDYFSFSFFSFSSILFVTIFQLCFSL
jgi:hypothetical protein